MWKIKWVRCERAYTGSFITIELPEVMTLDEAENFIKKTLPTWEVLNGSPENPDCLL
jgi:hypothetical protein